MSTAHSKQLLYIQALPERIIHMYSGDRKLPIVLKVLDSLNPLAHKYTIHSALMSNQTKVWKTKKGPLQGDKAWSRDPKSTV